MHQSAQARRPPLRDRHWLQIAVVLVWFAVAIGIILVRQLPTRTNVAPCPRSDELVPSCGVLLGITPPTPDAASLAATEQALGHRFAMVYTFHDINDEVPSAYDRAVLAGGALLHVSIDARVYGEPAGTVTWAAVAAGQYDADLTRAAQGIAALHQRVFVTFDHEPDQAAKAGQGTPAQFVAAWRHVHDLFTRAGATNAVWVWVVTGWAGSAATALQMWPGNAYVDWISWEGYDNQGCIGGGSSTAPIDFATAVLPFDRWLHAHGPAVGMDVDKPVMISESGSALTPGRPVNATWFAGMERVLRRHPQIKAVTWWDHSGSSPGCDYTFTSNPALLHSAAGVAALPWFAH